MSFSITTLAAAVLATIRHGAVARIAASDSLPAVKGGSRLSSIPAMLSFTRNENSVLGSTDCSEGENYQWYRNTGFIQGTSAQVQREGCLT